MWPQISDVKYHILSHRRQCAVGGRLSELRSIRNVSPPRLARLNYSHRPQLTGEH